jgi:hypothetical protein
MGNPALDTTLFSHYATMDQAMGAVPRSVDHIEVAHTKSSELYSKWN